MPLVKLTAPAGVVTDITDYQAGLRYTDSDKIRFRKGAPEKIGGWVKEKLLVLLLYLEYADLSLITEILLVRNLIFTVQVRMFLWNLVILFMTLHLLEQTLKPCQILLPQDQQVVALSQSQMLTTELPAQRLNLES